MGIFKGGMTNTDQGNIGLSKAIYELQVLGYRLSLPMTENQKYDLIAEKNKELLKVQIKTTRNKTKRGVYSVNLRTLGGNRSNQKIKKREVGDYDLLYVLTDDNESYLIPENGIGENGNSINMGKEVLKYKIEL